jgi:hypothetical protein
MEEIEVDVKMIKGTTRLDDQGQIERLSIGSFVTLPRKVAERWVRRKIAEMITPPEDDFTNLNPRDAIIIAQKLEIWKMGMKKEDVFAMLRKNKARAIEELDKLRKESKNA